MAARRSTAMRLTPREQEALWLFRRVTADARTAVVKLLHVMPRRLPRRKAAR